MRRLPIVVLAASAACGTPVPQLRLEFAGTGGQACPSTACEDIDMSCDAVMDIRFVDPGDATKVSLSKCVRVQADPKNGMCTLRSVDLPPTPVPVRDLDVQVAVYSVNQVQIDPMTREPVHCPDAVEFNATTGYPVEKPTAPALGG